MPFVYGTRVALSICGNFYKEVNEMNKWKTAFIFLAGFWLHEALVHIWLTAEGMLPLTSKFAIGLTITPDVNLLLIGINLGIFLFFAYLGFFYPWAEQHGSATPIVRR